MGEPAEVVLAVVGTRVLACRGDAERAGLRIRRAITTLHPVKIVCGGAKGIDKIAENIAIDFGFSEARGTLLVHRAQIAQFWGPGGYRERDGWIARDCTHLLRIACRQATTHGSGWTADKAQTLGRVVVRDSPCPDPV